MNKLLPIKFFMYIIMLTFCLQTVYASDDTFPITKEEYGQMFPNANSIFTYDALIEAAEKFPLFLHEGSSSARKNELIAFLANTSHETTGGWSAAPGGPYAWGMYFVEEVGCETGQCTQYTDESNKDYPPVAGQTYQGRGALQLSWNYNYGQASEAILGDKEKLLVNPSRVSNDPVLAWETAIWFWMTPQAPKPSAHSVMVGDNSGKPWSNDPFGETINIINGGVECGKGSNSEVENRIGFYKHFADILGTTVPDNLGSYCISLT